MASSGKHKTTMAKLSREAKLRERRVEKNQRKKIRKDTQASQPYDPFGDPHESLVGSDLDSPESPDVDQPESAQLAPLEKTGDAQPDDAGDAQPDDAVDATGTLR